MKLKAPKTWQMVLIFVTIIFLAVGGGVLYVYLNDGFKPKVIYPETIDAQDLDNVLNSTRAQYEATEDFQLTFTSQTEGVNRKGITLSFPSGIAVTRDAENGTISDGVITVPEKVTLGQSFTVSLVKQAYDKNNNLIEDLNDYNAEEDGAITYINKGGVSNLIITPESNTDYNKQITIAVDVPVLEVELKFVDITTGFEYAQEDGATIIPEGTNFVAKPIFVPQQSAYMFSDEKNSNVSAQDVREKSVYYTLGTGVTGIQLNQSDDGVYFTALEEVSQGNIVNAFAFSSSKDELDFLAQNSTLDGVALYNQAISFLSASDSAIKSEGNLSVVEANVGLFSILQNSVNNPYEMSVDKLFTILAGGDSSKGGALSATIQDVHGADLSGMIRNIGMRVVSATGANGENLIDNIVLRGGSEREASNGNTYVLINSNVRDLNLAYFELSSNVECELQLAIALIVQDEEGSYNIFEEEKTLYAKVSTHQEDVVSWDASWQDVDGINLKIIYENGQPVPAQYGQNLFDVANVPSSNVYQRKVVFAYGENIDGKIEYDTVGKGTYSVNGSSTELYPLASGELIANEATTFYIVFATVKTDAYNQPVFNENGTYKLIQVSSAVAVNVENSLRGIKNVDIEVGNGDEWLKDNATMLPAYAIPSGSNIVGDDIGDEIVMTIQVENGDEGLFIDEFENGNITFFASKDAGGDGEKMTNIFRFSSPTSNGAGTGEVSVNIGIEPNLKFAIETGENYYIFIEYDNSISTERKIANIGGEEIQDYITIYDQQTKTIESKLKDKVLNVTQTLQSDGTSEISITGLTGTENLDELNAYFQEYNETYYPNGIKTLDQYGREFEGDYTISSSNSTLVMANNLDKSLSFGNGSGNATVTIKSGSATVRLTLNVTSTGVSKICVLEEEYAGTSSVSYVYEPTSVGEGSAEVGEGSAEIKLKNEGPTNPSTLVTDGILTVYVGDKIYNYDKYKITLAPTFLSEVNDDLWDMISYKTSSSSGWSAAGAKPDSSTEIYSLRVNNHFGKDVTLLFNARNDNNTLNFTFSFTIKKTAELERNSLNEVNYGGEITGVEGHTDSNSIGVYAGFGINLNDENVEVTNYLKVKNVNWGAVFEEEYYIHSGGDINKTEANAIATIKKGVLTFNDVTQPTNYNFTLYAVNKPKDGTRVGNYYGYLIELSFTVYPNLKINPQNDSEISLASIASATNGYSYSNVFTIGRITTLAQETDSSIGTVPLDPNKNITAGGLISNYKFVDENAGGLQYLSLDGNNIVRTETYLYYDKNTTGKEIVLYAYDANGNVVASETFNLTLGLEINDLNELLKTTDNNKAIVRAQKYDGTQMALITQNSIDVVRGWADSGLTAELMVGANGSFYQLTGTTEKKYTISLNPNGQAIRCDKNTYLKFNFSSGKLDYATWDVPVILSQIGSDFPGKDTENDFDLFDVINNGIKTSVIAGGAYSLFDLVDITGSNISFTYLVDGEICTDYETSVISSLENGMLVLKNLSNNCKDLINGTLPLEIQITMQNGVYSQTFVLHVLVSPNATLDKVNYPYDGATAEFLTVKGSKPIVLSDPHDNGEKRFPDTATPTVEENITSTLTLSESNYVGSITINSKDYDVQYNAEDGGLTLTKDGENINGTNGKIVVEGKQYTYSFAESTLTLSLIGLGDSIYSIKQFTINGNSSAYEGFISLEGETLTIDDQSGTLQNATLVIEKRYSNFFGESLEYTFIINSTDVEYFLNIASETSGDTASEEGNDWVITLDRNETNHLFSITTKQRSEDGGESNVLPNEVTTKLVEESAKGCTFAFEDVIKNPKTLTITTPVFVEADTVIDLTFVVNDGQAEIKVRVIVPATVEMEWIADTSLPGGSEYSVANYLIKNLNKDGTFNDKAYVTINDVTFIYDDSINAKKDYLEYDTSNQKVKVQPIYQNIERATIKVAYTYVENITVEGKSYFVVYDITSNSLILKQVIKSSEGSITIDDKIYTVGTTESGETTLTYPINGISSGGETSKTGTITIGGATYTYTYTETVEPAEGTEDPTEPLADEEETTPETIRKITISKEGESHEIVLSSDPLTVTIGEKEYNVEYISDSNSLTLKLVFTSSSGSITIDGKNYTVGMTESGETTLTYSIDGTSSDGANAKTGTITIGDENYTYNYESSKLTLTKEGSEPIITYIRTGYTEKTFDFEPNLTTVSQGIGDVLSRETETVSLRNLLESSGTSINLGGVYSLIAVNIDGNLFDISAPDKGVYVQDDDLKITPEYVGQNTPTSIKFKLTYTKGDYTFTTNEIELTFTIVAAATYEVSYPNPFGTTKDLGYESYSKGIIEDDGGGINLNNHFGGIADFAQAERIKFSDVSLDNDPTKKDFSDIAGDVEYSIISFSGFSLGGQQITSAEDIYDSTQCASRIFRVANGVEVAEGASVTFGITYKGVTAQYTVYFFSTVISASTNNTINHVTTATVSYENIYADKGDIYKSSTTESGGTASEDTDKQTNIFAKNRLVELGILKDGAEAGSLQKIYARPEGEDDTTMYEQLASFVLTQSMIDRGANIFVDIGILKGKTIDGNPIDGNPIPTGDNLLDEDYEFVVGSINQNGEFVGSTSIQFIRQASRVEYKYRLSNGSTQLINSETLIVCEEFAGGGESSKFENGETATFNVTYKITEDGIKKGAITYKLKKVLDIEAQYAWSSANKTVIEIETNKINTYTIVKEMGIRHPSTGEMLSADNIGNAEIDLTVVNTKDNIFDWDDIDGGRPDGVDSDEFVYQTEAGDDYLSFTPIKNSKEKIYDYYLFGEGADNDGSYVLLKLNYIAGGTDQTFYFVVKLIPDYNVTIGGVQVAVPGVVTDGVATNEESPYNFVPDDKSNFNIATNSDSIISFVRSNWDSSNIAKSLTYKLTVKDAGNGYNEASNIAKLNIGSTWKKQQNAQSDSVAVGSEDVAAVGNIYTWKNASGSTSELKLVPLLIAFGQKMYMLEITNSWGFKIEFYFTLSSPTAQNPVISTAFSDATFVEGDKFDVGVIYDKIVATPVVNEEGKATGKYDLTIQRDNLPEDNQGAVKMIVVDNITTWGVNSTASEVTTGKINIGQDIFDNYMTSDKANAMTYKYVTIKSIGFKYQDEDAVLVSPEPSGKLITSSGLATPWNGIDYTGIKNDGRFTVPNLPGWYYGTSSSVQVEVHVTLQYSKNGDTETCDISFPATVSKQYSISTAKNVVIDGEEFALSDYIVVVNGNGTSGTGTITPSYYDDTLEVTLPAGGQATVNVEMTRTVASRTSKFEGSKTLNNTLQYRPETAYNSLSEILGMTLQPDTDTVKITVTPTKETLSSDDFRVRYNNEDIINKIGEYTTIGNADSNKAFAFKFSSAGSVQLTVCVKRGEGASQVTFENSKTYTLNNAGNIYVGTLSEFLENSYVFSAGDSVEVYYTSTINTTAELYYGSAIGDTDEAKVGSVVGIVDNKQNAQRGYQINKLGSTSGYWASMETDTLYIEDSGRFTNNYATVNKSYIVKVNGFYYRYNQVYWLTRYFYSLDTGLGDTTIRQIDADGSGIKYYNKESGNWENYDNSKSSTANFKIPISAWAKDVKIYQATQSSGQVTNGTLASLSGLFEDAFDVTYTYNAGSEGVSARYVFSGGVGISFVTDKYENGVGTVTMTLGGETTTYDFKTGENGKLISINGHAVDVASGETFSSILLTSSIYFEVTAGVGDVSTAYFVGTDLCTGPGYIINNQQYILVNIYVKASGGPDKTFERNEKGYDYRLGWFRVILV